MVTKRYPDGAPPNPPGAPDEGPDSPAPNQPHPSDKGGESSTSRLSRQRDHERALELVQEAMNHQMARDFDEAIRLYKESIALYPTADAHTYLGWTYSFQGKIDAAIAQCEIAIKLDPDFGNPYNDIGVYLIQQQRLDEAIPWLEKAKTAKRYEPRHFPHMNLGRIYVAKEMMAKAVEEFRSALALNPGDPELAQVIEQLEGKLQ